MCRVYTKGNRQYVRLCYQKAGRRGEKIWFTGEPPIGPSGHYSVRGESRSTQPNRRSIAARKYCALCGVRCGPDEVICGRCEYYSTADRSGDLSHERLG